MVEQGERRLDFRAWLLLAPLLALVVYGQTLGFGFTADDPFLILQNQEVTGPFSLRGVLLSDWFGRQDGASAIGYYRPVVRASLWATYQLAGSAPLPYHLGNLAVHALAAALLAWLAARMLGTWPGVLAGSLFAVHPATAQGVAIVTARSDVFACAFCLLCCALHVRWRDTRKVGWALGAAAAALLAFGSKESAVLLPVLVLATSRALGETWRASALGTLPVVLAETAFLALRFAGAHLAPVPNALGSQSPAALAGAILKAVGFYDLGLMGELTLRVIPLPTSVLDPLLLLGAATVAASLFLLVRTRLASPAAWGVTLAGISLAPALALWLLHVPIWHLALPVSHRWLYGPAAGAAVLAAVGVARLRPWLAVPVGAAAVVVLGGLAATWAPSFADDAATRRALHGELQRAAPGDLNPSERQDLLATQTTTLLEAGRFAEAAPVAQALIDLAPLLPIGWTLHAQAAFLQGDPATAAKGLERALELALRPTPESLRQAAEFGDDTHLRLDRPLLFERLGQCRLRLGDPRAAARAFAQSARHSPDEPGRRRGWLRQAEALERAGAREEASQLLARLHAERPGWDEALLGLAALDLADGRRAEAEARLAPLLAAGGARAERARRVLEPGPRGQPER